MFSRLTFKSLSKFNYSSRLSMHTNLLNYGHMNFCTKSMFASSKPAKSKHYEPKSKLISDSTRKFEKENDTATHEKRGSFKKNSRGYTSKFEDLKTMLIIDRTYSEDPLELIKTQSQELLANYNGNIMADMKSTLYFSQRLIAQLKNYKSISNVAIDLHTSNVKFLTDGNVGMFIFMRFCVELKTHNLRTI